MRATRLAIIGAGKLAHGMAPMLRDCGWFDELAIFSRSSADARALAARCGVTKAGRMEDVSGWSGWIMLASSDDSIEPCAALLAPLLGAPDPEAIVFHCSGSLPASALLAIAHRGWQAGSLHPACSFPADTEPAADLAGVVCGLEGGEQAVQALTALVRRLNGRPLVIRSEIKPLYHAATVIAHNYTAVLADMAARVAAAAGLSSEQSTNLLRPLMTQAVTARFAHGAAPSLTGPAVRGDARVISAHLAALGRLDPKLRGLYRELGRYAADIAHGSGVLSDAGLNALEEAFLREGSIQDP